MITSHVWRPFYVAPARVAGVVEPCAYLECGRPKSEHATVGKRGAAISAALAAKAARS